jgi:hypothetical protein
VWYLKSYTSGAIPTFGNVHKKCKIQASTIYPNASLCIMESTPFMKIDDKWEEII